MRARASTLKAKCNVLHPWSPFSFPQGAKHQLIGEARDYRVLEIAFGHFEEEDIVRLTDKYGRI